MPPFSLGVEFAKPGQDVGLGIRGQLPIHGMSCHSGGWGDPGTGDHVQLLAFDGGAPALGQLYTRGYDTQHASGGKIRINGYGFDRINE